MLPRDGPTAGIFLPPIIFAHNVFLNLELPGHSISSREKPVPGQTIPPEAARLIQSVDVKEKDIHCSGSNFSDLNPDQGIPQLVIA